MNILITGVTGFLGNHIGQECHNLGYNVIGLVRNSKVLKEDFQFPLEIRYCDLNNNSSITESLNNIDVIIHSAANTDMGAYKNIPQDTINVNVLEIIIEAVIKLNIIKLIFISTANTIRPGNTQNPGNETNPMTVQDKNLNYINSKIEAENRIKNAIINRGLSALILNPTFLIGPIRKEGSSGKLFFYIVRKMVLFYPKGGKNLVDVRDVAKACANSIKKGRNGENYILSNVNLSFKSIFHITNEIARKSAYILPIPSFILSIAGELGSLFERIIRKPVMMNHKSAKILTENHYYSNQKAISELGFTPRNVELSLQDMVQSIKKYEQHN